MPRLLGKVGLEEVQNLNEDGHAWVAAVEAVSAKIVTFSRQMVTGFVIKGAKAHKSSSDPSDPLDCLTVGYYNEKNIRMLSAHIHKDGSYNFWTSRRAWRRAASDKKAVSKGFRARSRRKGKEKSTGGLANLNVEYQDGFDSLPDSDGQLWPIQEVPEPFAPYYIPEDQEVHWIEQFCLQYCELFD